MIALVRSGQIMGMLWIESQKDLLLEVGTEGRREVKDDSRIFGLSNLKNIFTKMGKTGKGQGWQDGGYWSVTRVQFWMNST